MIQHFIDAGPKLCLHQFDNEPSKRTVLCLHGFMDTGRSFEALSETSLSAHLNLVALDWRGHGQSQWVSPLGSYHLLDHAKDLNQVLNHFEKMASLPDIIIGHSMAVNIILTLFGAYRRPTIKLVFLDLLGPPAEAPAEQPERLEQLFKKSIRPKRFLTYASVNDAIEHMQSYHPHLSETGARRMLEPILVESEEDDKRLTLPFDPHLRGPTPIRYPEMYWQSLCQRIQNPVLVIRGEHGYVAEDIVKKRGAYFNNFSSVTLDGAGHHIHVTHPEAIASLIQNRMFPQGSGTNRKN